MDRIIPDPDFKEFDGVYVGSGDIVLPPSQYNLNELGAYMRESNKSFHELSKEELNRFLIN